MDEVMEAALRSLSRNPKGIFLMVEGGKIDWACHSNDLAAAVRDVQRVPPRRCS